MADEEIDVGPQVDVDMEEDASMKRRGRGFNATSDGPATDGVKNNATFDLLDEREKDGMNEDERENAARSVEGWIVIVTNIDEEATEEEVVDKFADFGAVKNCHLNLDRRTGYVKGYALLEYERLEEAKAAIEACRDDLTLMDKPLKADFAFVRPPANTISIGSARRGEPGANRRNRSRSPARR